MKAKIWKAFLPIGASLKAAEAPAADAAWLMSRGIESEALSVLRLIRTEVLPLIRRLEQGGLDRFSLLVHDRTSGVPTVAEDFAPYIDLTLHFKNATCCLLDDWCFVKPAERPTAIAGIDGSVFLAEQLICEQSAWYLRVIESYTKNTSDIMLLGQIRQFLHYFANMAQMKIG